MTFGSSFWKKGQCFHILWSVFSNLILQWLQKYVIAKSGETRGSRTALLKTSSILTILNLWAQKGFLRTSKQGYKNVACNILKYLSSQFWISWKILANIVWLLMLFVGGSWTIWVFGLKWWRRDPGTQIKLLPFFSSVPMAGILDFKMAAIFSIFWPTSQLLSYLESSKWWQNVCFW